MPIIVESAFPGARGADSLPFSMGGTERQAKSLKAYGMDFFVGYLGAMNPQRLAFIMATGLAFMPVTFASEYKDGAADEIAQLKALGVPKGVTVWLDMEGTGVWEEGQSEEGRARVTKLIEGWAAAIVAEGYIAGLYVGAPQPFTGRQLFSFKGITRYWLGGGRCIGYDHLDAYPDCGWCMRQDWHNNPDAKTRGLKGGILWPPISHFPNVKDGDRVFIDTNAIQADHRGRLPTWMREVA